MRYPSKPKPKEDDFEVKSEYLRAMAEWSAHMGYWEDAKEYNRWASTQWFEEQKTT